MYYQVCSCVPLVTSNVMHFTSTIIAIHACSIRVHVCMFVHVSMHMCARACLCAHACLCVHTCASVCMRASVCVRTSVCMHTCVPLCACTHMHAHYRTLLWHPDLQLLYFTMLEICFNKELLINCKLGL